MTSETKITKKRGRKPKSNPDVVSQSHQTDKDKTKTEEINWNELLGTKELGEIPADVSQKYKILYGVESREDENAEREAELNYYLLNVFKYKLLPKLTEAKQNLGFISSFDLLEDGCYPKFVMSANRRQECNTAKTEFIGQSILPTAHSVSTEEQKR